MNQSLLQLILGLGRSAQGSTPMNLTTDANGNFLQQGSSGATPPASSFAQAAQQLAQNAGASGSGASGALSGPSSSNSAGQSGGGGGMGILGQILANTHAGSTGGQQGGSFTL